MISILHRRSVHGRLRATVFVAMMPLVILNSLPLAAGCICADGHFEPVCRAGRCQAGLGDCGCPCCAHGSCSKGKACCHRSTNQQHKPAPGERLTGNRCCHPQVHDSVPTVDTSLKVFDGQQVKALQLAPINLPYVAGKTQPNHLLSVDIARPPNDLVITLQRLVI